MPVDYASFLAGTVGGIGQVYAGAPFDLAKVRMQAQASSDGSNILQLMRAAVRQESFLALYKGCLPAVASAVLENTVVFGMNGWLKSSLCQRKGCKESELSLTALANVGGVAGIFSAIAICPAETIKCRMQVQLAQGHSLLGGTYSSPLHCAMSTVQSEGTRGLFRGLPAQLARDVPFCYVFFGSYEAMCYCMCKLSSRQQRSELSATHYFVAGGLAGMAGWTASIPMDVLKSRMQISRAEVSLMQLAQQIVAKEGASAFFKGWTAAMIRAFPANAAVFLGYELSYQHLARVFGTQSH